MSWKSCSAKRLASHIADSASASGVALPYFSISRFSGLPALPTMRQGMAWPHAAAAISFTWSSNLRMLPGLTRTAAQPASIAANTYLGWKWMSAITGICDLRAIAGSASASSWLGQATRTMSQPEAVSSAICCRVALTSAVRLVVIDCTEIGYSEPTPTAPTCSCRVGRRGASGAAGGAGIPRETLTTSSIRELLLGEHDRVDDVGHEQQTAPGDEHQRHHVGHRHELRHVHRAGVGAPEHPCAALLDGLPDRGEDLAAVQRRDGQQVEQEQRDVHGGQELQEERELRRRGGVEREDLSADPGRADDPDGPVLVALLAKEHRAEEARHPRGQLEERLAGAPDDVADLDEHRAEALARVHPDQPDSQEARPDRLAGVVGVLDLVVDQRGGERDLLPRPLHDDGDGALGALDRGAQAFAVGGVERPAVERDDAVAGSEARRCGGGLGRARRAGGGLRGGGHDARADRADRGAARR